MGSRYCLRLLFALFPACVTCLGNYEVITPEVKQMGRWNDPAYSSVYLPQRQGTRVKSDPNDCQTAAESDNQENMIGFQSSSSVPKSDLSGFGQPSAQYESRTTDTFKNIQPSSQLASTSSPGGSTLMRALKVPKPKPFKPSRDDYSYTETSGSRKVSVVTKPPKNEFVHQHSSSKGSQSNNKVQTASSSYGPLLKGTPVCSRSNPREPLSSGFKYTEDKASVVSSGAIFLIQGGGSAQDHGDYNGLPDPVKPLGVPSHVDSYQASQISRDIRLTASSQGKSWNQPLQYSMGGTSSSPEPRKLPLQPFWGDSDKSFIASSGETLRNAPESAQRNALPRYEVTHPKFQQTYNVHGPPSQINKPMYPSPSGDQRDVAKYSTASSGAILIMQDPTTVRTESNKPEVHPSFPEHRVTFASRQTAHQPFEVTQNSLNVQPATSTYASSSRTGYQTSSLKGTSYKPKSTPSQPSNEIKTVRVRLHKPLTSSFGNSQNQWAPGGISNGALQSSLPPSYLGQRPGQRAQMPVSSSAPQYYSSKGVQGQFTASQRNPDYKRHITAIPSGFGQGAIRRLFPTLSSNYRQVNQPQGKRMDSSSPKCKVIQNSPAGPGQQGLVKFQNMNLSI
ncbi:uncharacterized protein zgc:175136 [Pseudorasbora parva]|uniref:uncharacterized protein zgc:175136 n=1 Tax=Pseudorasbora parva TaxID=51549 RepID=UPI00351F14FF